MIKVLNKQCQRRPITPVYRLQWAHIPLHHALFLCWRKYHGYCSFGAKWFSFPSLLNFKWYSCGNNVISNLNTCSGTNPITLDANPVNVLLNYFRAGVLAVVSTLGIKCVMAKNRSPTVFMFLCKLTPLCWKSIPIFDQIEPHLSQLSQNRTNQWGCVECR